MPVEAAISVQNVSKIYKLYDSPVDRLKESLHPLRKKYHRDFYALRDVSFDIKRGESFGIVGKNGSGKSTLLKIITSVLTPSTGSVKVDGKISALLELGTGFNPELTGIENVFFNGTLMGYTREQMEEKLDGILSFADIGAFAHQPVKTYSNGMFIRLAFAVAVIVEPDILVVDEALSVGDVFFQQKCYAKIREIISTGTTCLFVSHDTTAVTNLCDRVLLLDNGFVDFMGAPEEGVSRYFGKMGKRAPDRGKLELDSSEAKQIDQLMGQEEIAAHNIIPGTATRHGSGGLKVEAARVVDAKGNDTLRVAMMEPLTFFILLRAQEEIFAPSAGIHIFDRLANLVFAVGTRQLKLRVPKMMPGDGLVVKMQITFSVQPGEYTFSLGASEPSEEGPNGGHVHDRLEMLGPITVEADAMEAYPFYGIAQLPVKFDFFKATAANLSEGPRRDDLNRFLESMSKQKPQMSDIIRKMEFEQVTNCWCGGELKEWLPDFYDYFECVDCGCKSVGFRQTERSLMDFYSSNFWLEWQAANGNPGVEDRYDNDLVDRIPVYLQWVLESCPPPAKVLEIGCGNGRLLLELAQMGFQCTGTELDRSVATWVSDKTGVKVYDTSLPPDDGTLYDLIVLIDVVEHVYDPDKFVKDISKYLAEDGKILFHCPVIDDLEVARAYKALYNNLSHIWMPSSKSIHHLFNLNSFSIKKIGEHFGMPCYITNARRQ